MTLGPAALVLIGFLVAIVGVTGVFGLTQIAAALRRRGERYPSLG